MSQTVNHAIDEATGKLGYQGLCPFGPLVDLPPSHGLSHPMLVAIVTRTCFRPRVLHECRYAVPYSPCNCEAPLLSVSDACSAVFHCQAHSSSKA